DENYIKSQLIGVGIKVGESVPYYIDYSKNDIKLFREKFIEYFEFDEIEKYGHMMKIDIFALLKINIDIKNIVFDTMIGQYLLNPAQSNYSINELGKEYLNIYGNDLEELLGKGKSKKTYKDLPINARAEHISQTLDLVHGIREPIN